MVMMLGYLSGALMSPSVMHWITPQILLQYYNVSTAETCTVNVSNTVQCVVTNFQVEQCMYIEG